MVRENRGINVLRSIAENGARGKALVYISLINCKCYTLIYNPKGIIEWYMLVVILNFETLYKGGIPIWRIALNMALTKKVCPETGW